MQYLITFPIWSFALVGALLGLTLGTIISRARHNHLKNDTSRNNAIGILLSAAGSAGDSILSGVANFFLGLGLLIALALSYHDPVAARVITTLLFYWAARDLPASRP